MRVFALLDGTFRATAHKQDGTGWSRDRIADLEGNTRCLLKGERTALNLLQHMSGSPPPPPKRWRRWPGPGLL